MSKVDEYVSQLMHLSYDFVSGSDIMPCNKIDKPLWVYRFLGNIMTFITILRMTKLKRFYGRNERAALLALVCDVYCDVVTFPLVSWGRCGA